MASSVSMLAAAFLLTAAAFAPGASAAAQHPLSDRLNDSSAQRSRVLAQAAPAAAAALPIAAGAPPGAAGVAGGAPGAPPGPPPNSTQLAGIIIGSFNASADTTPQVCQPVHYQCADGLLARVITAAGCCSRQSARQACRSTGQIAELQWRCCAGAGHAAGGPEQVHRWRCDRDAPGLAAGWQLDVSIGPCRLLLRLAVIWDAQGVSPLQPLLPGLAVCNAITRCCLPPHLEAQRLPGISARG